MVGISVALAVEHLPTASVPSTISLAAKNRFILIPNLDSRLTVKANIKQFVEEFLYIPSHLQSLSAPLFTKLSENESVEDLYRRYDCHAEAHDPDLHVDEDTYTFWGREAGKSVDLQDGLTLEDYHILDKTTICLKTLPEHLPKQGGRIFVETKDGILPLVGVSPLTRLSEIKRKLETMTGIPAAQQLLSSVGRVMHDDFHIKDFKGFHAIYEGSIIDLCKSGDSNLDQAHRRMIVFLNVEEQTFTLVVQPSDLVQSIMKMVESRTGISQWQQRITFSGKTLQEKKTLAEYFIYPECTIDVNVFKNPLKTLARSTCKAHPEDEHSGRTDYLDESAPKPAARKFKLVRTQSGHVTGVLTIPVLTTDRISDLKRKIKRSLQPLVERNIPTGSSTAKEQQVQNVVAPKIFPATGGGKFSIATNPDQQRPERTTSAIEKLLKQVASSGSLKSPSCKKSPPQTPTAYFTPPDVKEYFSTPPTKLGPPTTASPKVSDAVKSSFLVRKLYFGSPADTATSQSRTSVKNPCSPLRQIFPQTKQSSENQSAPQGHLQKGTGYHGSVKSNGHDSENDPNQPIGSEKNYSNQPIGSEKNYSNQPVGSDKKSIGTWLTENMHSLKGHIRSPFTEK